MHNNKTTKVFALFISLVLVFAVVFSVAACSKKKPHKTIEKQTEQQIKGKTLDKLYEFMSIKNMEFDVNDGEHSWKTYAGEKYSYNSAKNSGFINFDSWVHEFKLANSELKIGRRAAKITGFPHYRRGDYVRGQFFSIQASMTDKDMYTLAAKNFAGGYAFTVDGDTASTTNHNVIESISNSLGSKVPYEEVTKAVFTINKDKLTIKLMKDDKVVLEASMDKKDKVLPAVSSFLANNSEYKTNVKMDDSSTFIKKLKELIANEIQAYNMHIKDYSHIVAGTTKEDINSGNDWEQAKVKEHDVVQYFGNNESFKFNSNTREFKTYKKHASGDLGIQGIYSDKQYKNYTESTNYQFAKENLVKTILSNMDKIKYLQKTDEYIFDYKDIIGFESLLENVFEITNKKFFGNNKIDTVTLSIIDNKLCINVNRKLADNESLSKKIVDNVVAIQAIVDFSDKLNDISNFATPIKEIEKQYVKDKLQDIKDKVKALDEIITTEGITLGTDLEAKYGALKDSLDSEDYAYDIYTKIAKTYSEVESLIYSKSTTLLKKSIRENIDMLNELVENNFISKNDDDVKDIFEKINNKYNAMLADPDANVEDLRDARSSVHKIAEDSKNKIVNELSSKTQEIQDTQLEENSEPLYTDDSIEEFKEKRIELNGSLKTVADFVNRRNQINKISKILRVLTRYEERELESLKVWYSIAPEMFNDDVRETIQNAKVAFDVINSQKRPIAKQMLDRLRMLYDNLIYLKSRDKEDHKYNELKEKLTNLKKDTKYDKLPEELKGKVEELLNLGILHLKDAVEVIEQMENRISEITALYSNDDKIPGLKNKIEEFIKNDTTDISTYGNGAEYKKLIDEIKSKKDVASYEQLVEYDRLITAAKDKLVETASVATSEQIKKNLQELKNKINTFYNGDIPTVYEAEVIDSINNNKQNLVFKNNKYVFNLTTKNGVYKEGQYKVRASLNDDNELVSKGVDWFTNIKGKYFGHLRHNIEKTYFNKNATVLNGTGFSYVDESDDETIPVGFKDILSLLGYKNIDRIVAVNNADNSLTFVGYRKVNTISGVKELGYYEVFRMKATPTVNNDFENKILTGMNKNKAPSWEDIKLKLDSSYKMLNGFENEIARYSNNGSVTEIGNTILREDGTTAYKLFNNEIVESSYMTSSEVLQKIKKDISEIIKSLIKNANPDSVDCEIDDKKIISRFRDVFGIVKGEDEIIRITRVGNELLIEYENTDDSFKFKMVF